MTETVPMEEVQSQIYRNRGKEAMLDRDLAMLYGVKAIVLRQQVFRNKDRFPSDFMFQLSNLEVHSLVSQNVIPSRRHLGGYLPYAFTEQGVAMLSGILRSKRAVQVNIAIMRAFVKLRHALLAHQGIARRVEKLEGKVDMHETDIRLLVQDVAKLKNRPGPGGPINPNIL
jgi:hypothetical protein